MADYSNLNIGMAIHDMATDLKKRGGIIVVVDDKDEPPHTLKELVKFCEKNDIPYKFVEPDDLSPEPSQIILCGASVQHEISRKIIDVMCNHENSDPIEGIVMQSKMDGFKHDFNKFVKYKPDKPKSQGKNPMSTGPGFKTKHHIRKRNGK